MERQAETSGGRPAGRRWIGAGVSLAAHLAVLALLVRVVIHAPEAVQPPPPPTVQLVPGPPAVQPSPTPSPQKPEPVKAAARAVAAPTPVKAAAPRKPSRPAKASPEPDEEEDSGPSYAPVLSGAELAGATSADAGGGGGPCNMARRLQAALGKDLLAQEAIAHARLAPGTAGQPIVIWNGDWVQSGGEDGRGLSAVREAVMWEVGFAPAACRAEPVHGYILLTLNRGVRVALGAGRWRWSDLLGSRPTPEG